MKEGNYAYATLEWRNEKLMRRGRMLDKVVLFSKHISVE